MTFCAGFIRGDAVFLLADGAVSSLDPIFRKYSSVGELHESAHGYHVEERILKLRKLAPDIAITYAGTLSLIETLVDYLSESIRQGLSLLESLATMERSAGPFDKRYPTTLIIAQSKRANEPLLCEWSSQSGLECGESFYLAGSILAFKGFTESVLSQLTREGAFEMQSHHRLLNVATSIVQSFGVRMPMIQEHIGGSINGLFVSGGEVQWRRDTGMFFCDEEPAWWERVDFVRSINIHDAFVVQSTFIKPDIPVFTAYEDPLWLLNHEAELDEIINRMADQFIFISTKQWRIVISDGEGPSKLHPHRSVFLTTHPDGKQTMAFADPVGQAIGAKVTTPDGFPHITFLEEQVGPSASVEGARAVKS